MSEDIIQLSPYQHVRQRTEMYFGSRVPHTQDVIIYNNDVPEIKSITWVPAIYTAFREILDNALDEIIGHGHGNRLDISYDEQNLTFEVKDNGRGIPIDWNEKTGMHNATLAISQIMAGRNFGEREETAGVNGIGASGTNFCSEWFNLEIYRDNKKFTQKFEENVFGDTLKSHDPKITDVKSKDTGTKIKFKLSDVVFHNTELPEEFVRSRVYEIALINPNIKVYYNGSLIKTKKTIESTIFPNNKSFSIEINNDNFYSKFIIVPNFVEDSFMYSVVNNIPAFNGGIHMESFRKEFVSNLISSLEKESKRRKLKPNRTDILDGLLIYNYTKMKAPNFDSQSKTRLINEEAGNIVKLFLNKMDMNKEIVRKQKWWIDEIYHRCSIRTNKKEDSELEKEAKRLNRKKVPKLLDATSTDRKKCTLIIAEGDSAISSMSSVRDSKLHGGLPLRGKILNVNGENPKKVLENSCLSDIITSLGLEFNKPVNKNNLRYGKIFIAHDMDPDGLNIGALLINFLYTYWPELFDPEHPFVYIFNTPFIIAEKGKERKYWYSYNQDEFKYEDYKGWSITRAKGLGTLELVDWEHSLQNPNVFPVIDDGLLEQSLDLVFNTKRADERKEWIGL